MEFYEQTHSRRIRVRLRQKEEEWVAGGDHLAAASVSLFQLRAGGRGTGGSAEVDHRWASVRFRLRRMDFKLITDTRIASPSQETQT
jgi:hypothetical protein